MEEKIITAALFKSFSVAISYIDEVEYTYKEMDIPYTYTISYRILFEDYIVRFFI